ncbi:MAG: low molecular weight phosphatase family protein [Verrucomicrobiota bacterium]
MTEQEPPWPAEVLFLCTGNYYRSRFAEEYFNHIARQKAYYVRASSKGFRPDLVANSGPMSSHALRALQALGITPAQPLRMPVPVNSRDFLDHKYCIALSKTEHLPMMQELFPQHIKRVQFWEVEDLLFESPESALASIAKRVEALLEDLR